MKVDATKFANKKELFAYLVTNKKEIAEFKKTVMKFSDCFGAQPTEKLAFKSVNTHHVDNVESGTIKRTIIGNTYNWMDSHDDVHINGLFAKSINERAAKIWHLHDHEHKMTAKIGKPTKIYESEITWKELGVNKAGNTMALFMDSEIKQSMNKQMFNSYLDGEVDQHSVGMVYVKMELAINDSDYKEEFATFNKYISDIGNKEKAIEKGFFWAQKEAKLMEISAVLEGSNELTPTVSNIVEEPAKEQPKEIIPTFVIPKIDYAYIAANLKLK